MVLDSNTVINPGAMVIKTFHTPIADGAMSGPWGPYDPTIRTDICWVDLFEKFFLSFI